MTRLQNILYRNPVDALDEFLSICTSELGVDLEKARNLALDAIKYYKGNDLVRAKLRHLQLLEKQWYNSLKCGAPDYSVYNDQYLISDLWACWMVYSRDYFLRIISDKSLIDKSIVDDIGDIKSIADLGCGIGYTSACLKLLFPNAKVTATNIPDTYQYRVANIIGKKYSFEVLPEIDKHVDLVFASEYFEHIETAIENLQRIIYIAEPKYLLIANAFDTKSLGHFNKYNHCGIVLDASVMNKHFNSVLKSLGYEHIKTKCWNNRPAYWKKITK